MTEKHLNITTLNRVALRALLPTALALAAVSAMGAQQTAKPNYPTFSAPQQQLQLPKLPVTQPITPNGAVVEDVIARINDQIITRSEYEQALASMMSEGQRQGMTQADFDEARKNLFRDMIDQQILVAKGKELGITGDAEMTRRLDDIRKQNHLDSMEALEKAAASQGVSFEDFKQSIRNNAITQKVVQDEVGRHLQPTHAQEVAFYEAHAKEFTVPEQIHLSEILIPTPDNATDAQVAEAQKKADDVIAKLKGGMSFSDAAKSFSGGPGASTGGDLGDFKRGTLGDVLENATFSLAVGANTQPIRTKQGFVILKVDSHQQAGVPPMEQVEEQVQQGLYMDALQPALRDYLTKMRTDMYVEAKAGFVDTGAILRKNRDTFTAYKAPAPKKKTVKHEQAEAAKAAQVQAELAAARAKVAQKNAEKAAIAQAAAAKDPHAKNAGKAIKPPKIRREKIRYGQSPRNSLPTATTEATTITSAPLAGQAPGTAMALTASTTTITTGGAAETVTDDDPLAIKAEAPTRKTRFSQRQHQEDEKRITEKLAKVEVKVNQRPVAATSDVTATEKQQAAPLGLNGDTTPKKKKQQPVKGAPKERFQSQPSKPVEEPAPAPAPTANPSLVTTPTGVSDTRKTTTAPSADQTTLPPSYVPPNSAQPGTPIPATTSADPNAPVNTPSPK